VVGAAELLWGDNKLFALYQGMTSVVPKRLKKDWASAPALSPVEIELTLRWQGLKP
jgi:hypothetical protein